VLLPGPRSTSTVCQERFLYCTATSTRTDDGSGKSPHYYQQIAINRTVDAIMRGQDRILLVMATGTGKTYTAFQIIWRLWKSGAN
jgi:type I restriction enzyme, R subunit